MQSNNNSQTEEENTEEKTEKRKRYEVDQVPIERVEIRLSPERMDLVVDELGDCLLSLYRQLTFTENFDSFAASNFLRLTNLKKESSDAKAA